MRLWEMGVGDVRNDQGYHTNMKQSYRQIDVAHNQVIQNKNIPMANKNVLLLHLWGKNCSKKFSWEKNKWLKYLVTIIFISLNWYTTSII